VGMEMGKIKIIKRRRSDNNRWEKYGEYRITLLFPLLFAWEWR